MSAMHNGNIADIAPNTYLHVHLSTGQCTERMWLCYSHSKGKVYCFTCTLLTHTNSAFTYGFKDWKHGDERIAQR